MYIPLVGQGVAYSIYAAALWPSVQATVGQVRQRLPISEDPQRHFDLGPHFDGHVLADIWFPSNIPRLFGPFDVRFG